MLSFFLTTPLIEIVLGDLNKIIHSSHIGGSFNFILNPETENWLFNHFSNQDANNPGAQSHNIISLVTLLKAYPPLEPQVFTSRGTESNLLKIFSTSYDAVSSNVNSLENLTGFQFKFISKEKSAFRTLDILSSLSKDNERFTNFVAVSGSNLELEGITQILSEQNIDFGVINAIEEDDFSRLLNKEDTGLFNGKFLTIIHKYKYDT